MSFDAIKVKENTPNTCKLLLHKINYFYDDGITFNHSLANILEE